MPRFSLTPPGLGILQIVLISLAGKYRVVVHYDKWEVFLLPLSQRSIRLSLPEIGKRMIGVVALEVAGSLLSLSDLFDRAYKFLKDAKETRELSEQLRRALRSSLERYSVAMKASLESGKNLRARVGIRKAWFSAEDLDGLLQSLAKFCEDFEVLLSSVLDFSKQCHVLVSDYPDFMRRVETKKPKVHAILSFFGKHFDPKTGSLDLATIPMLFKLYGPKIRKRESDELSKEMAQHRKMVRTAIQNAMLISKLQGRKKHRHQITQFQDSLQKMLETVAKLKSMEGIQSELSGNAPPWMGELSEIVEDVTKSMADMRRR